MNRRPLSRLASLRSARRRLNELAPPPPLADREPLPPLEPPDDDREFIVWPPPGGAWPVFEPKPAA
jgi:hypothetical protein